LEEIKYVLTFYFLIFFSLFLFQGSFKRGSLSSIWYPSIVTLAKAEIRRSRIIASLATADDGDMSFEEAMVALKAITTARTCLDGHIIGNGPPTLFPTVLLFYGRFQRLVLTRRNKSELMPIEKKEEEKEETTSSLPLTHFTTTGVQLIDDTIQSFIDTIDNSIMHGGHDHLLLRASLLELCSLYGNQWIPSLSEQHKRIACHYLIQAANAGLMYTTLRSDVQDIASNEVLTAAELATLPTNIYKYLINAQLKIKEEGDEEIEDETNETTNDINDTNEDEMNKVPDGFTEDGTPVEYSSPLSMEEENYKAKAMKCIISRRSVMYYYLELLQQRRICNAATNNDGRR
jgi:hypothetical protein